MARNAGGGGRADVSEQHSQMGSYGKLRWAGSTATHQNKEWTAEQRYELVAQVLAGKSIGETAISVGIDSGQLHQWVKRYKIEGYQGLTTLRKGRPPKEPQMKKKIEPAELTPSEREEMIRLKARIEYLEAENAVIKKEIALREEKWAAQLKAKKQRSSKNSVKKDMP